VRVAFIHPSFPGDEGTGATFSATQTIRALQDRGQDIDVFCAQPPPNKSNSEFSLINITKTGYPFHPRHQMNKSIRDHTKRFKKYDIVHCYEPTSVSALEHIGSKTPAKTVVTLNAYGAICPKNDLQYNDSEQCHQNGMIRCTRCSVKTASGHERHNAIKRSAYRLGNLALIRRQTNSLRYIDAFRAPSSHVKQNYSSFGYPERRIHVIPHIMDDTFMREHDSNFESPYRLLYVGYLEEHKGVDKLVPILNKLKSESSKDYELTIVGDGGLRSLIEKQISEYDITDAVTLSERVANEELPSIYAAHDVFLHPSQWEEPLARVYLEAIGTKTPVITRDFGSIDEILGRAGATCDGTIDGFVETISSHVESGRLPEMSEAAASVSEDFTPMVVGKKIEEMYQKIL